MKLAIQDRDYLWTESIIPPEFHQNKSGWMHRYQRQKMPYNGRCEKVESQVNQLKWAHCFPRQEKSRVEVIFRMTSLQNFEVNQSLQANGQWFIRCLSGRRRSERKQVPRRKRNRGWKSSIARKAGRQTCDLHVPLFWLNSMSNRHLMIDCEALIILVIPSFFEFISLPIHFIFLL